MTVKRKKIKPGPVLVISDSTADRWWKWSGRVCLAIVPLLGALWWVFGWYNGVEAVKFKVGELSHRVEAMWEGQTKVLEELKRISTVPDKKK